ncbi:DNA topoisomerase I, mitochondrial isoform X2 [Alosa sapidissima]|uniref:DNA topoisomerase I, mitochondrial isoform X2 n=1 Tax=Alosa sapidissima TaxID=34773 RepID=UPI001C089C43|nr:DNA topoisomerase I, mitochondrial isoform X2 [Alosa sapidissima]
MRVEDSGKGLKRTADQERETERKKKKKSHLNGTTEVNGGSNDMESILQSQKSRDKDNGKTKNKDIKSEKESMKSEKDGSCKKIRDASVKNSRPIKEERANDSSGAEENIPIKEENEPGNKVLDRDNHHTSTGKKQHKDHKRATKKDRKDKKKEKPVNGARQEKTEAHNKKRKHHEADDEEPKKKRMSKGEENKGGKGKNKKEEKNEQEKSKWKWWEESKNSNDGQKWKTLEHRGPLFPPEYEPLPNNVPFYYGGEPLKLSLGAEEVATFYAKMLEHEYTTKEAFQKNFFTDWKEVMTKDERHTIKKLAKCDFSEIHKYFVNKSEEKKNMTKQEKQALKEEANKLTEEYGYCLLDGHREKIGNFRVEPPGLFRGRGEHPKMGKLKKRVQPEDVIINCSKDSKIPVPPPGHKWKRVQHDNTVTWLTSWVENVQNHTKYVMLNPSSKLKGEKDWQKYEVARSLKLKVDSIRRQYQQDWSSREMKTRQRGVALYFIDKLALRAGNEKEDDTADTVGCCSLRVEHISLHESLDGQEWVVEFDFLGKDSIRYYNKVPVEKKVFKSLKIFMENKDPEDDLFDRITTTYLNKKLNECMAGLTAKVFRTFNASTTLQDQLSQLTKEDMTVEEKILSYNRANRAVAILCNHQRAAPKTFEKSMQLLQEKIQKKKAQIEEAKKELKKAKKTHKEHPSDRSKKLVEQREKAVRRLEEQLKKLELQETDREENKVIALGTSKLNYLDPRISVAWCKKYNVPIEKIYNKTQREKFAWAIDMTDEDFQF